MIQSKTAALLLAGCLILTPLSGCTPRQQSPAPSSEAGQPESSSQPEESPSLSTAPEPPRDFGTVAAWREGFEADLRAEFGEPEMVVDGVIHYENNQRVFHRDILLANGNTRHLSVRTLTDVTDWSTTIQGEWAESAPNGNLLAEPRPLDPTPMLHYRHDEETLLAPELWYAGWTDEDHFYLSASSGIWLYNADSGGVAAASPEPFSIFSKASGLSRSYLSPVNTPFVADGKLYYTGFRDPQLLNRNGALYELSLTGERELTDDAYAVAAAAETAVVFLRNAPAADEMTPEAQSLWYYDIAADEILPIFTDVRYILDDDYMTADGQLLGNYWAGKQWLTDNPEYVIGDNALLFYVSRIADEELDHYRYDFATRTLEHTEWWANAGNNPNL